jgi:hypothetical protein
MNKVLKGARIVVGMEKIAISSKVKGQALEHAAMRFKKLQDVLSRALNRVGDADPEVLARAQGKLAKLNKQRGKFAKSLIEDASVLLPKDEVKAVKELREMGFNKSPFAYEGKLGFTTSHMDAGKGNFAAVPKSNRYLIPSG